MPKRISDVRVIMEFTNSIEHDDDETLEEILVFVTPQQVWDGRTEWNLDDVRKVVTDETDIDDERPYRIVNGDIMGEDDMIFERESDGRHSPLELALLCDLLNAGYGFLENDDLETVLKRRIARLQGRSAHE